MLVHLVADYGHADLAFAEVIQRIRLWIPGAEPVPTSVPAFSTLATGFCIGQLGLNAAPPGTLIFHNVAPRADNPGLRPENAGEPLAFGLLPGGVRVIGPQAGYTFSFIRDLAQELRWVSVTGDGSQFRSRDFFPKAAADILAGSPDILGERIGPGVIPDIPKSEIAYIDGYGNLKTTIRRSEIPSRLGAEMQLRIGETVNNVIRTDEVFGVRPGQIAFSPGSSGWTNAKGEQIRWMEIFLRGGSAWERFGRPEVGTPISNLEAGSTEGLLL